MKIISLGAGVQSTALVLMSIHGDLERADRAIFSDTGWEPKEVYNHLDRLIEYSKKNNFEIEVVSNGNIRNDAINEDGHRFASMPLFIKNETSGEISMLRRQCSKEYKIIPVQKRCRELGASAKNPFDIWMGISTDEIQRMKDSRVKYTIHKFPLIEARMNRNNCRFYLDKMGWENVPKSSCIGCPFHDDNYWNSMKQMSPNEFNDAVEFDAIIRDNPRLKDKVYLHRSGKPLKDIDFESDMSQFDMFLGECDGVCGL
jgi:hypothetical protein